VDNPNRLVVFGIYSQYLADLADVFKEFGYRVIYWCYDDWEAMEWPFKDARSELNLIQKADQVLTTSTVLEERILKLTGRQTITVRNGFSREQFPCPSVLPPRPEKLLPSAEKNFIYWGHLASHWIDWDLLHAIVGENPKWHFNLIGDVFDGTRKEFESPNIRFQGELPVHKLLPYGLHSDIGFIHFKNTRVIQAVNPVKAYEYLACGLPVISTPMRELSHFPATIQIETAREFAEAVRYFEAHPLDTEEVEAFLQESTWKSRALKLLEVAKDLPIPTRA
jgi:glycosyltransferase involved in cell wall biosynthesis